MKLLYSNNLVIRFIWAYKKITLISDVLFFLELEQYYDSYLGKKNTATVHC